MNQPKKDGPSQDWRLCVAPMIDVSDRHCRYFHRMLAPGARLYTEMITTGALLHGDCARHLDYDASEHPLALQLGGSEPAALAACAKLGEKWGYDEINLNCGCPSERVQSGAFGACLMAEAPLVAACVRAMQDACGLPVSVKHRLGLEYDYSYDFVRDFVGVLYLAGCRVFIVHARNAVLRGLSPKENREVPPLRYDFVARLKQDFPAATIVLNGGLQSVEDCLPWLEQLDGVMLGRAAWHHPDILRRLQLAIFGADPDLLEGRQILERFMLYMQSQAAAGVPLHLQLRGLLGWHSGKLGARRWRRMLSDPAALRAAGPQLLARAWQELPQS